MMGGYLRAIDSPPRPECGLPEGTTVADAILLAVASGNTREGACLWAGVWPETVTRWVNQGANELVRMALNNTDQPQQQLEAHVNLTLELAFTEQDGVMRMIAHWSEHFEHDWRAVAAFMAKRYPVVWGDPQRTGRLELSGPGGGPVQVEALGVLSLEEAEALLSRVEARVVQGEREALLAGAVEGSAEPS